MYDLPKTNLVPKLNCASFNRHNLPQYNSAFRLEALSLQPMVSVINRVILFVVVLSSIYSFYVHNDVDMHVPFVKETIFIIACVLAFLFLVKFNYKWQSLLYIKKRRKEILYVEFASRSLQRRALLFEVLDVFTYFLVGTLHFYYPVPGLVLGVVLSIAFVEGVIYSVLNYNTLKIGITSSAIILATNRPNIIRVGKLKAILNKSGNYICQHSDGRVDSIEGNWVSDSTKESFNSVLKVITSDKGIFFDDFTLKN